MNNKIKGFLATIAVSLMPFLVLSEQIETQISADTITVRRGEVLYAEGNVLVQYGNNEIKAKALEFNQKSKRLKFIELQDFYDGKAIRLSAEQAVISNNLSEGIISAASLLLDDAIKIQTEEVTLRDGEISSAKGISRVTSCEKCEGKDPKWYLTASSAKRDIENSNIVYRNVTVRVKGLPVAYIPYLRLPDPSVDRARGFLVPEAVITSNLATGLKLPYFIPTGVSSDILITPYFSSKTKTLEYRYRKKFRNGDLILNGAFSDDDLGYSDLRYFAQLIGNFKLGYGIDLNFDAGKVGDTSYLTDYVYSEESDFDSEISLGKTVVAGRQFFDGDLSYLRERKQDKSLREYYSLSGSYVKFISSMNLPGKLGLSANLNSSVNVNDDKSISRPPSSAQVGLDYNQLNFIGQVQLSTDLFGRLNSFVNSADAGTMNEEFSMDYGAVTSISSPRYMEGKGKLSFLNPKLSLSFSGQENDIVGDYFIGMDELSWGNIHASKKIVSLTESETGFSLSLGFDSQVIWENGQRLEIEIAASKIDNLTYTPSTSFGLVSQKLNYLGKFSYQTKNANSVSINTHFSSGGRLLKGDVNSQYSYNKFDLRANYEILDKVMDSRLSEDLRTINLLSSYNFLERVLFSAGSRYDLRNDQLAKTSFGLGFSLGLWEYSANQSYLKEKREKFSLSATYEDECTHLIFSLENRYQGIALSKPVKSLVFRVQLKPFANAVFSQGGNKVTF